MKNELKVLELFAGIGAPRKALARGGYNYKIIDTVEIDPNPVKSYNAIYGENIQPQDITKWNKTKEELGEIDLIWNSSPCQDFSVAGKGAGGEEGSGTRSSLIYEVLRITKEFMPKYIVWENVKGLTTKKHKHILDDYIKRLEELGYKSCWQILNSKDYGIPQHRERVFVISIRNDIQQEFKFPYKQPLKLKLKDCLEKNVDEKYYFKKDYLNKKGWFIQNQPTAHSLKDGFNIGLFDYSSSDSFAKGKRDYGFRDIMGTIKTTLKYGVYNNIDFRIRKLTPLECWNLMGFDDDDLHKAQNTGLSDTQLYKQAGNSVVVNVIESIFSELLKDYQ